MNRSNQSGNRRCTRAVLASFSFLAWSLTSQLAQAVVLIDDNSTLTINPVPVTGSSWTVGGVEQMKELSNWWRVGSSGPEANVAALNVGNPVLTDSDFDGGGFDRVTIPYSDPAGRFNIEIDYTINGFPAGSGKSAFDEEIRITNLTGSPLQFHMFEYIDLDLDRNATPADDTVLATSPTSIQQYDSTYVGDWGMQVDRYELNTYPNTLNKLSGNSSPDNLSTPSSTWPAGSGPVGPADVTFALQWDFVGSLLPRPAIPPGATVTITKEGLLQRIVPEPATCSLMIVPLAMLLAAGVACKLGVWQPKKFRSPPLRRSAVFTPRTSRRSSIIFAARSLSRLTRQVNS